MSDQNLTSATGGYWPDPSNPANAPAYERQKANNRYGFVKGEAKPEIPGPTILRLTFGEWQQPEELADDSDLGALKELHGMAQRTYHDTLEVIDSVAGDDDPSLNHDGRLKIAAKIIEPKIQQLAGLAERELAKVDESLGTLEAEITKAVRSADQVDVALHADIRAHIRSLKPDQQRKAVRDAIDKGDIVTLQAIATAPPYLSGLQMDSAEDGVTSAFRDAVKATRERMAPAQVKRLHALQQGRAIALQALGAMHKRTHGLIDFDRASRLNELETQRKTKHG